MFSGREVLTSWLPTNVVSSHWINKFYRCGNRDPSAGTKWTSSVPFDRSEVKHIKPKWRGNLIFLRNEEIIQGPVWVETGQRVNMMSRPRHQKFRTLRENGNEVFKQESESFINGSKTIYVLAHLLSFYLVCTPDRCLQQSVHILYPVRVPSKTTTQVLIVLRGIHKPPPSFNHPPKVHLGVPLPL